MATEREWAAGVAERLRQRLGPDSLLEVLCEYPLRYSAAVVKLDRAGGDAWTEDWNVNDSSFKTDILVGEYSADRSEWRPRVVIECKLNSVTSHDVLTYGAKASRHRQVFPHLRYGMLVGGAASIPARVVVHGEAFDFVLAWPEEIADEQVRELHALILEEVEASRQVEEIIGNRRRRSREAYRVLRRRLELVSS